MNTLRAITLIQWLGIIILFNTVLIGGTSQLSDLFLTPIMVKAVTAFATLVNGFFGGLVTMFGGPGYMKDSVGNMKNTTVVTDSTSAAATNNPNVIAATPAVVAAIKASS